MAPSAMTTFLTVAALAVQLAGAQAGDSSNLLDVGHESHDALSLLQQQTLLSLEEHGQPGSRTSNRFLSLAQAAVALAEGGEVTPAVTKFLTSVLKDIKTMFPKIDEGHTIDQASLDARFAVILKSFDDLESDKASNENTKESLEKLQKNLTTCRDEESEIWEKLGGHCGDVNETTHGDHELTFSLSLLEESSTETNIPTTSPDSGVKSHIEHLEEAKKAMKEQWMLVARTLTTMRSYFLSNSTSEGEMLDQAFRDTLDRTVDLYLPQNVELDERIQHYEIKKQIAEQGCVELEKKKAVCDGIQKQFEEDACGYAFDMEGMCSVYNHSYSVAASLYEKDVAIVKGKEKDRKVEYTGLMDAQCILSAILGSTMVEDVNACKTKTYSTDKLDVNYTEVPAQADCPPVPPKPCGREFININYRSMPPGTKAGECIPCR